MIDKKLQQDLRERFSPEGSMLRKQQLRMLEILLYIDKVCKEHGIRYWLSSGTLLGAVRHGGFIPWDDDLDIEMMREDYVRFLKVFPKNGDYALQTLQTDPNYFYGFAKVRDLHSQINEFEQDKYYKYKGLFVDIFSIEPMPLCMCRLYGRVFGVIERSGRKYRTNRMAWLAIKVLQKLVLWSIPVVRPVSRLFAKELHHSYGTGFLRERHSEDIFPLTEIEFEGHMFPAPKDSDSYLKAIYRDYLKLPDPDSIEVHTSSCIFLE